jgi:hypothetical protein
MVWTETNISIVVGDIVQLCSIKNCFFLCYEKHNYGIDLLYCFSCNSTTCFDLIFCFRNNNNNKFYNNCIITVCMERPLPFFILLVKQYSYLMMAEIDGRNM